MKIGIIGTGYVGLVQGVVLSNFGLEVICMDVDEKKIKKLQNGISPIYEPGLEDMLEKNINDGRIEFTSDIEYTVKNSEVIFIAVGTPSEEDGSADLHYVLEAAKDIGRYMNEYKVIVDKSTVPVRTGKLVMETIKTELSSRDTDLEFDVVSNPEFLREGKAIGDCLLPNRIVIGTESEKARDIMKKVYDVLYINHTPFVFTNLETAEMIKYASNAFLAVKISFINEMALLAEKVGANTQEIARAMGMDGRISEKFLHCGPGFGGSCFPKDTKAIVDLAKKYGEEFKVIQAAIDANSKQKRKMVEKILKNMGSLDGKSVAVLGLSFKPETDDMRDAPSIDIINGIIKNGASVKAFCPKGMDEARWRLENVEEHITYCADEYSTVNEADAVVLITEWSQFRGMNLKKIKNRMKDNYFFDLRNIFAKNSEIRDIFKYFPVGQS